jgi:Family of unknown function (DUF6308)
VLLDEGYARGLLRDYFRRDGTGYVYSGAMFDTYPADLVSGIATQPGTADEITDSDLVALSMLGIRVTGYEALIIMQDRHKEIEALLASIPAEAHIEEDASTGLLARGGPAWTLWELLREIKDRTKEARFGAVAAGKLLARKRPGLIPIEDSRIAAVFCRRPPDRDEHWWDDVRSAALDPRPAANGTTLWRYLAHLRNQSGQGHLPVLRVLDIIGWMHAHRDPGIGTQASTRNLIGPTEGNCAAITKRVFRSMGRKPSGRADSGHKVSLRTVTTGRRGQRAPTRLIVCRLRSGQIADAVRENRHSARVSSCCREQQHVGGMLAKVCAAPSVSRTSCAPYCIADQRRRWLTIAPHQHKAETPAVLPLSLSCPDRSACTGSPDNTLVGHGLRSKCTLTGKQGDRRPQKGRDLGCLLLSGLRILIGSSPERTGSHGWEVQEILS